MAKLIRLDNGLKIYYQKHAKSAAIALGVFVGAGCFYENKEDNGISHFIEHTVFKGTKTRSAFDIANETDKRGIMINAYTGRDATVFYTVGLSEYADTCADILSDILFNATFAEENLEKEKGVVIEEIKMYADDTEDVCLENLSRAHYGNNNVSYPILGNEKNVLKFTREDIVRYMEKYYRADNACVSIVGSLSEEEAVTLVKKYFSFPEREKTVLPKIKAVKPKAKYVKISKPLKQSAVGIAFPAYSGNHKKRYLPSIVSNILGEGMSSRLFQKVREKAGLVYEIYSTVSQYDANASFVIYFGTAPDQTLTAVKKVAETLKTAVKEGFTADEFEKAVAQFKTSLVLGSENSSVLMRRGGHGGLKGKLVTSESILKEVSSYTLDDVNACLREIIDFSKASLSYVGKKQTCDLLQAFTEEGKL